MKCFKNILLSILITGIAVSMGCKSEPAGSLQLSETNPRYFTNNSGKAVYLTGSHTWNNLVDMTNASQPESFDYDAYLYFLKKYNHNFFRMWTWDLLTWNTKANFEGGSVLQIDLHPWERTGPGIATDGQLKFDLTKYNQAYFNRLRERIQRADEMDIYVAVMLFEGWGLQFSENALANHPFYPQNNMNEIEIDTAQYPRGLSIFELVDDKITKLQEEYITKVIETVGEFDNVLYEISNENHPASTEWQFHMIRFIKAVEAEKGFSHPVGMTYQYRGGSNQTLFDSPADWISPNNEGGYRDDPPVNSGEKVVLSDTDHLWGIGGSSQWVWKSFLRGLNPIFMDPYKRKVLDMGKGDAWQNSMNLAMGFTKEYADRMDLIYMVPDISIASSGYCLANIGNEYLVYIPEGITTQLDLTDAEGSFSVEWFNPEGGVKKTGESISGGEKITLEAPFKSNEAVVYLKKE